MINKNAMGENWDELIRFFCVSHTTEILIALLPIYLRASCPREVQEITGYIQGFGLKGLGFRNIVACINI